MSSDLALLLKVQSLDIRAAQLATEVAALPKRIAEIERTLDAHKRRLEMDRAALAANLKERRRADDDVKVHEQKISKLRDQMLSAKTNEQYKAFQNEIDYCQKEIRKCEDRVIELMSESEPLELAVKKAEGSLAEEAKQVDAEKKSARELALAKQQELAFSQSERLAAAASARKDFITNYERIRKRPGVHGVAVVEAAEGKCYGCHMTIRPALLQQLREGTDEIVFCEACKRILFFNPPVLVENA